MSQQTATTTAGTRPQQKTMKAMVQEQYGPASRVLELRETPVPEVGATDVLVRVHASSVNAREWHLINGKPYVFRAVFGFTPKSNVPGFDVSGVVEAVGPEVSRFQPGDEVFGEIGGGSYAEYAIARETGLARKPDGVSFEDAAAVPTAGLTALQGLRDVAGVEPGHRVLINGASGGVGTYAIQVAKALGAHVTAVVSTRNVEQARHLGADVVVDYLKQDITRTEEQFDVVFDGPSNHSLRDLKRMLAPHGVYVMVGGAKHDWTGPLFKLVRGSAYFAFGSRKHATVNVESRADDLETLGDWLDGGKLTSVIEDTFPLADVATPLDRQGQFHARGKTVVAVKGTL